MNGKVLLRKFALVAIVLFAAGCSNAGMLPSSPAPGSAATASPSPAAAPPSGSGLAVAFVKDGNIQLWDESTGQIQTIVDTGDVIAVTMSDDGQVIAYLRRSAEQRSDGEWIEQSALWAVDRNGGSPRELVSVGSLRQRLNAAERDSTNIPQMQWIPGTHRLLFSGWKYIVQAEGEFACDTRRAFPGRCGCTYRHDPGTGGKESALRTFPGWRADRAPFSGQSRFHRCGWEQSAPGCTDLFFITASRPGIPDRCLDPGFAGFPHCRPERERQYRHEPDRLARARGWICS